MLRKDTGACIHCAKHAAARSLTRRSARAQPLRPAWERVRPGKLCRVSGAARGLCRVASVSGRSGAACRCVRWTGGSRPSQHTGVKQAAVARADSYRLQPGHLRSCTRASTSQVPAMSAGSGCRSGPCWYFWQPAGHAVHLTSVNFGGSCQAGRTSAAESGLHRGESPASALRAPPSAPPQRRVTCGLRRQSPALLSAPWPQQRRPGNAPVPPQALVPTKLQFT